VLVTYRAFIEQLLIEASSVARENFGKVTGTSKGDDNNQVLTETDLAIGAYLVSQIRGRFPEHNVIDEEMGAIDNGSIYTWVVDPVDGTSNFASGLAEYAILLGLLKDGEPIAGGIALPNFDKLYLAERGKGATCNGRPVRITAESRLLSTLVAYGIDGHQEDPDRTHAEAAMLGDLILAIRNLRSSNSAYDFAMVAQGSYGAYLNQTSKIWDNVAPQIVLEEAGAMYTDFFGRPMDYSRPLERLEQNFTCCVAAPQLHSQLQTIIHAVPE